MELPAQVAPAEDAVPDVIMQPAPEPDVVAPLVDAIATNEAPPASLSALASAPAPAAASVSAVPAAVAEPAPAPVVALQAAAKQAPAAEPVPVAVASCDLALRSVMAAAAQIAAPSKPTKAAAAKGMQKAMPEHEVGDDRYPRCVRLTRVLVAISACSWRWPVSA